MKISIIGTGYVGLITGVGFAEVGHEVVCMDIDAQRIIQLDLGMPPIFEPGLESMLLQNQERGLISFTTSMAETVDHADAIFIAVGTPSSEDGSADLSHVMSVAIEIGNHLAVAPCSKQLLVVVKSTVPVGTCARVRTALHELLVGSGSGFRFHVASNPEFLAEGVALKDFMNPSRIVCGVDDAESEQMLRAIYKPFNRNHEKMIFMDVLSSELTKYSANAMLAAKISLMNELALIAGNVGADIEQVRKGIGSDPRIGYHFIYPGPGYGGSCFPKDVRALARTAMENGVHPMILDAVEQANRRQKTRLFEIIQRVLRADLHGSHISIWGAAFKPQTDDIREAPSLVLIDALLEAGAIVQIHDPQAAENVLALYNGHENFLTPCEDQYDAIVGADVLVMVTEWKQYWSPDFKRLAEKMNRKILVDARNIWNAKEASEYGFTLYGIGRPPVYGREQKEKENDKG